jgi:hypothetical protein
VSAFLFPDCILYAVGKPVFHRFTDKSYGAWMRDPHPKNDIMGDKYWVTKEEDNNHLFEFANKAQYRKNTPSRNFTLNSPFMVCYRFSLMNYLSIK